MMIFALDCVKCLRCESLVKENSTGCVMDDSGKFCPFGDETKFKCSLKFSQIYTVLLLSFRTGIIKRIWVKGMALLFTQLSIPTHAQLQCH